MAAQNDSPNEEENGPRLDLTEQFQWSLNSTVLKRLIPILSALVLGGGSFWGIGAFLQDKSPSTSNDSTVEQPASDRTPSSSLTVRYTCDQLSDRQTAQQLLAEGHTYLDRDGDGVACDSLN